MMRLIKTVLFVILAIVCLIASLLALGSLVFLLTILLRELGVDVDLSAYDIDSLRGIFE